MEGTGLSLFQGSDSIKLNTSLQRQEEEEFLEEEKKRNAELKNLFENAFDDLIDDDDDDDDEEYEEYDDVSTINSSQQSLNGEDGREVDYPKKHKDPKDLSMEHFSPVEENHGSERIPLQLNSNPSEKILHNIFRLNNRIEVISLPDVSQNNVPLMMLTVMFSKTSVLEFNAGSESEVSSHYGHCFRAGPSTFQDQKHIAKVADMDTYKKADGDFAQLQVLYDVRMREIENLNHQLLGEKSDKEKITHKLALAEAEKESLLLSSRQAQDLLVASKEQFSIMEEEMVALKANILQLEREKEESNKEVEIAKMQIANMRQKMEVMERCDATLNREKQMDALLNTINAKHKQEMTYLQKQLDDAITKLKLKDSDYNKLENKLDELQRKHSALVLDKCDSAVRQESTVQFLLEEANKKNFQLNKALVSLKAECDSLRGDLEQYENVAKFRLLGNSSSEEQENDSMLYLGSGRQRDGKRFGQSLTQADITARLKEELHRALLSQKAKRFEIRKLQEQVHSKELHIQEMKEKERIYLAEAETLKSNVTKVMEKLEKVQQNTEKYEQEEIIQTLKSEIFHLETEKKSNMEKITSLEAEIGKLKDELNNEILNKKKQGEEYIGFHDRELAKIKQDMEEMFKAKESEWRTKVELLLKECDEVKQLYLEIRASKDKLVKMLEEETQKHMDTAQERDSLKSCLASKGDEILKLETLSEELKREKYNIEDQLKKYVNNPSFEQSRIISSLEAEVARLQNELLELPKKQTLELEGLKQELGLAKARLIELEKELRLEFEREKEKLANENSFLCTKIQEKETEIRSLHSQLATISNEMANVPPELPDNNEKEEAEVNDKIETLSLSDKSEETKIVKEKFRQILEAELQGLEAELTSKHRAELSATEERVKNLTFKYFTEERKQIDLKHKLELQGAIEKEERMIEDLKKILIEKQREIENLKQHTNDTDLKEKLLLLQSQKEEERNKVSKIMAHWAKEVQDMKSELENSRKESFQCRLKLQAYHKKSKDYKIRLKEKSNLKVDKYKKMLSNLQDQVEAIVSAREIKVEETLQKIEQEYQNRERELLKKLQERNAQHYV